MEEKIIQILMMLEQTESEELKLQILRIYERELQTALFFDVLLIGALIIAVIVFIRLLLDR